MKCKNVLLLFICFSLFSCSKFDVDYFKNNPRDTKEDPSSFSEIASLDIGEAGAAEISAYDPKTKRLFVVNNSTTNKIDVVGLQNFSAIGVIATIDVAALPAL